MPGSAAREFSTISRCKLALARRSVASALGGLGIGGAPDEFPRSAFPISERSRRLASVTASRQLEWKHDNVGAPDSTIRQSVRELCPV